MTARASQTAEARLERFRKVQFLVVAVGAVVVPALIVVSITFGMVGVESTEARITAGGALAAGFGSATLATMAVLGYAVGQRPSATASLILALIYLAVGVGLVTSLA